MLACDGYWQGSVNFKYSLALLVIDLKNYYANMAQYRQEIKMLVSVTDNLQNSFVLQNFAWNLILIMEFSVEVRVQAFVESIYTIAIPAVVFNTETKYASIATKKELCLAYEPPIFDTATGLMSTIFKESTLRRNCSETIDFLARPPNLVGDFEFKFDMNSFSVAATLNMGYVSLTQMENVPYPLFLQPFTQFYIGSTLLEIKQFVKIKHPRMDPVFCVVFVKNSELLACFLRFYLSFYLPIINHAGGTLAGLYNLPQFCDW